MPASKWIGSHPYTFFFLALVLGFGVSITFIHAVQLVPGHAPWAEDILSDRQKALMSEEQDMSKWLLGLASGALAAALATRISDKNPMDTLASMSAYAFLIVSMFGAFLSHEIRLSILAIGPLDYVYSPLFLIPTRVQFWSFVIGISALGWSVFKPRKATAIVALLLFVAATVKSHAQAFDQSRCVTSWYADRFGHSEVDPAVGSRFLSALETKARISPPAPADADETTKPEKSKATTQATSGIKSCEDAQRVLDRVRLEALASTQLDSAESVTIYMKQLQPVINGPGATASDAVLGILSALAPWNGSFGVLFVKVDPKAKIRPGVTFSVYIDELFVGQPTLSRRISVKTHRIVIRSSISAVPVYTADQFSLADGENKIILVSEAGVQ